MQIIKRSTLLFAVLLFLSIQCHAQPSPRNQVHFINVGQAEAILLEFQHDAVLIDAGGEFTCDDRDRGRLLGYLNNFFARRTDLVAEDGKGKIHTIIISHPHIDHTMLLMDVMQKYRVANLVDGGQEFGSGIVQLWAARYYAQIRQIKYDTVKDPITETGLINAALQSIHSNNPDVTLKFLAGARNCKNANNDSLILWAEINGVKFLFTGDDEALVEENDCEPEIPFIINRFKNTTMLDVDVYKVGHHGSFNGTSLDLMRAMTPKVSVMSAGRFNQQEPGRFHAWQFGHPRDAAVQTIAANTTNTRTPVSVKTMNGPAQPRTRVMKKAVYCTCWDNDVVVEVLTGGTISVH